MASPSIELGTTTLHRDDTKAFTKKASRSFHMEDEATINTDKNSSFSSACEYTYHRIEKHATMTEQRNKYFEDFRQYQPLKKFSPRTTVPKPFSFRTEERAKIWSLHSKSRDSTPITKQFKALPMPNFDNTGMYFTSPTTWKEKNFTIPEAFDFETDKRMKMRSSKRTHDDNEVGRYRFKALALPDFTYKPSGIMHEVNLTVPFPFHLEVDERITRRIRFHGTSRSKEMGLAKMSHNIRTDILVKSSSSGPGHVVNHFERVPRSNSVPKGTNGVNRSFDREGKSRSNSLSRKPFKARKMPKFQWSFDTTPKKECSFKRKERLPSWFKARKMPDFSNPFVPVTTRGRSNDRGTRVSRDEEREPSQTAPRKISIRSTSIGPPMNYLTRSLSNTPTRRRNYFNQQGEEIPKFRAKPMPDFSRQPNVKSRAAESPSPARQRMLRRNANSVGRPPIRNGFSSIGSPIQNQTPPRPPVHHSPSLTPSASKVRMMSTSPNPFKVSERQKSPLSTYPLNTEVDERVEAHSQNKSREKVGNLNMKNFKARPMPGFYNEHPLSPQINKTKEQVEENNKEEKKFKARPLPGFYGDAMYSSNNGIKHAESRKDSVKMFKARPMPGFYSADSSSSHLDKTKDKTEEDIEQQRFLARPLPDFYGSPGLSSDLFIEQMESRKHDGDDATKMFKARPMPGFYNDRSPLMQVSNGQAISGEEENEEKIFKARPLPGFYGPSEHGFDHVTRLLEGEKNEDEATKMFKARPMPNFYNNSLMSTDQARNEGCEEHDREEDDAKLASFKALPMPDFYNDPALRTSQKTDEENLEDEDIINSAAFKAHSLPRFYNDLSSLLDTNGLQKESREDKTEQKSFKARPMPNFYGNSIDGHDMGEFKTKEGNVPRDMADASHEVSVTIDVVSSNCTNRNNVDLLGDAESVESDQKLKKYFMELGSSTNLDTKSTETSFRKHSQDEGSPLAWRIEGDTSQGSIGNIENEDTLNESIASNVLSPQGNFGDDFHAFDTTDFRGGWSRAPTQLSFSDMLYD